MRIATLLCLMLALGACSSKSERTGLVTLRGDPVTLEGHPVHVGQPSPNFTVVAKDLSDRSIADYRGKTVILSVVPSLDTGVCSTQTKTFNERAASLPDDVVILTLSMDLPFAQARWCGANDVANVVTLSDYKYRSFAEAYGLRIKENGLLARAIYVLDRNGVIRYQQIVPELTREPDYDAALAAAASVR
jgi:thioredoxin-dependent peroxiredoxin